MWTSTTGITTTNTTSTDITTTATCDAAVDTSSTNVNHAVGSVIPTGLCYCYSYRVGALTTTLATITCRLWALIKWVACRPKELLTHCRVHTTTLRSAHSYTAQHTQYAQPYQGVLSVTRQTLDSNHTHTAMVTSTLRRAHSHTEHTDC